MIARTCGAAPALLVALLLAAPTGCDSSGGPGAPGDDATGSSPDAAAAWEDAATTQAEEDTSGPADPCAGVTCDAPPGACWASVGTCVDGACEYGWADGAGCDDGDPCTTGDTCQAGACQGAPRICDTAPDALCSDGATLVVFTAPGACAEGACSYASTEVSCGIGCSDGACQGDPCAGVTCDTPPGPCYQAVGTCSSGQCSYAPLDGAPCNDGNPCTSGDTCAAGACKGAAIVCEEAPAPECTGAQKLRVFTSPGICGLDGCMYSYTDVACPDACVDGQCVVDLCAGVSCDAPPGPCHAAPGTCQDGQCTYPTGALDGAACDDGQACTTNDTCQAGTCSGAPTPCEDPPPATCSDDSSLLAWNSVGTCEAGVCSYTSAVVPCPGGCAGGACVGDPCAGVVCTTPPSPCYSADGWCRDGLCSYAYAPLDGAPCDDGQPCTTNDACAAGACAGAPVPCDAPPAASCADDWTLWTWGSVGSCGALGLCDYVSTEVPCADGCDEGACLTDLCAGVECTQPPGACYLAAGTCEDGACSYDFDDGAGCDDGDPCSAWDACDSGLCLGEPVVCDDPPDATCDDDTTLLTWSAVGACDGGGDCVYESAPFECAWGCEQAACAGDPCGGVSCDDLPEDLCTDDSHLRVFTGGACSGGACTWSTEDTLCAFGCADAACVAPTGVVISELLYDAVGGDEDVFVELHGPPGTPLDGFVLQGVNGASGAAYQKVPLDGHALGQDGLLLIAHPDAAPWILDQADLTSSKVDYQNGPDSVALVWEGLVVDAVAYGEFGAGDHPAGEGAPAEDPAAGWSLTRDADYTDTDDNAADFTAVAQPTPGAPYDPEPLCTGDDCEPPCEGECGLTIDGPVTLCGEQVVPGPLVLQGGALVTCPEGDLTFRAASIFIDPASAIDLSATSDSPSGDTWHQCSGSCNGNGIVTGSSAGGNGTAGGDGMATQYEVKEPPCGGYWGWSCKTCDGPSGGAVRDSDHDLQVSPGGRGGDGCEGTYPVSGACSSDTLPGGLGGGRVRLFADTSIQILGEVRADGGDGDPGDGDPDVGAAGGAGGSILIVAPEVTLGGLLSVAGGHGTWGSEWQDCDATETTGADGGKGRVKIAHGPSPALGGAIDGAVESISFLPPLSATSATHPDPSLHYHDDFEAFGLAWEPPLPDLQGYYTLVSQSAAVQLTAGNGAFTAAPTLTVPRETFTAPGAWWVHVLSVTSAGELSTLSNAFPFHINAAPPELSSASHPDPSAWYADPPPYALSFAWSAPAGVPPESVAAWWYRLDHQSGATPGKAAAGWQSTTNLQVLLTQDSAGAPLAPGTWYLHLVAEDTVGNLTTAAAHHQVQLGPKPAQMNYYGYVTATEGGAAVDDATLTLEPYGLTATTDDNGYFLFPDVYEGAYTLTVSRDGQPDVVLAVEVAPGSVPASVEL